jgi:imidazolonepropionase-like amidohydrolase
VSAADLQGEDDRVGKWREAGFTAALSAPADGIFTGQAALIGLSAGEPRQRVVADGVAQRVNFATGGFRSYPGSLMGVLGYVKQVLSDAAHYRQVEAIYAASPRGRLRPTYDRTLAPLASAVAGRRPFLLPADQAREIDRALAMASEYALTPVLYGGQGAYARAAALAAAGVAVVVSVDWPEEAKDRDPDADTPFRTFYHRRMAPTAPAALAAAKVPFSLYSGGQTSPAEMLAGVRAAVAAGLDPDQALVALTSGAARIFGVGDRLGTIE